MIKMGKLFGPSDLFKSSARKISYFIRGGWSENKPIIYSDVFKIFTVMQFTRRYLFVNLWSQGDKCFY